MAKKGHFWIFPWNANTSSFGLQRLGLVQKLANSNEWIAKKCEKPPFLGILGQNGQFWTVFDQNGQKEIFSKTRLEHFYRAYKPWLTAKFQKKVMKGFRKNALWTAKQTNGQGLNSRFLQISFDKPKIKHFSKREIAVNYLV